MKKHTVTGITQVTLAFSIGIALCLQHGLARSHEIGDSSSEVLKSVVPGKAPIKPEMQTEGLSDIGSWLNNQGITPHISVTELYQANPSAGAETGNSQAITLISLGLDFDAAKIGIRGGVVHFEQLFAPYNSNLDYRAQLGDVVSAIGAPYLPKVSHLQTLTYEQKLFDEKLTFEFGKLNAIYRFAVGLCNTLLTCQNTMLITGAGFNPFPYSDWSTRLAYDFSPRFRVQAGVWRSNANFFNHSGWTRRGDAIDPTSTVFLGNLVYRSTFAQEAYPATYEVLGYHNNGKQNDRFLTATGQAAVKVHDGTSGIYLGARKVIYRPDRNAASNAPPTALSVYGSVTHSFDPGVGNGIRNLVHFGLITHGLLKRRPTDTYSLSLDWGQLTKNRQQYTEEAHRSISGSAYRPGRNEYAMTLDANFALTKSIIFSPYVRHTWNTNNWFNALNPNNPEDGFTCGLSLRFGLDKILNLNEKR